MTSPSPLKIINGVTLTPPVIGRIMTGHTEMRPGKQAGDKPRALPAKDDHFTITTLKQLSDRSWEPHPLAQELAKAGDKLTQIPVRIAYNDPNLSLHNRYSCFDPEKGRVLCSGDGVKARRATENGVQTIDCPRAEACEYGQCQRCKNMSRVYLQIAGQKDELGLFVLRTTSHNTLDRIAGKLNRLAALTGNRIAGMPLMLTICCKTSAMSMRTPFWFVDLVQRPGMSIIDSAKAARDWQASWADSGLDLAAMEQAALLGLANGEFADEVEDVNEWLSDEDLAREAERNLQRGGLRGLDQLRQATSSDATEPIGDASGAAIAPPAQPAAAATVTPRESAALPSFTAPGPRTAMQLGAPPVKRAALPDLPRAA